MTIEEFEQICRETYPEFTVLHNQFKNWPQTSGKIGWLLYDLVSTAKGKRLYALWLELDAPLWRAES